MHRFEVARFRKEMASTKPERRSNLSRLWVQFVENASGGGTQMGTNSTNAKPKLKVIA